MSISSDIQKHLLHKKNIDAIAERLPDSILKQSLSYLTRGNVFDLLTSSRGLHHAAKAALYSFLVLENRDRVDRLMVCYPDPDEIAGYIETLEVPGALSSPAREYIDRLVQQAHNLHRLRIGAVCSADPAIPYMPTIPENHKISTLVVGEKSCSQITPDCRMITLAELRPFPNLTNLAWFPVDPRIGSVQYILSTINQMCPNLIYLQVPWADQISAVPWDTLPRFQSLKELRFRFDHESQINLLEFVKCLDEFYSRNIKVRIGSSCALETVKWLQQLYVQIHVYAVSQGRPPHEMLAKVFQHNRGHRINFRDIHPTTLVTVSNHGSSPTIIAVSDEQVKESLYQAVEAVDYSDQDRLRVEMDLTALRQLPNIMLSNKLHYARLLVTRQNVPPHYIPEIIRANPKLTSLTVAKHVQHYGESYDGNCTYNKVPLIPRQDRSRASLNGNDKHAVLQRYTIPGFELVFRLSRTEGRITQQWKAYTRLRGGPLSQSPALPKVNVFGTQNWVEEEWSPRLLDRLKAWEDEIKGWFDLAPKLTTIVVVLNTDCETFGKIQKYWCTCNQNDSI